MTEQPTVAAVIALFVAIVLVASLFVFVAIEGMEWLGGCPMECRFAVWVKNPTWHQITACDPTCYGRALAARTP